jgi:hypothetical protein
VITTKTVYSFMQKMLCLVSVVQSSITVSVYLESEQQEGLILGNLSYKVRHMPD